MPEPVYFEDGDSDGNPAANGPRTYARRRASSVKPGKTTQRPASDSGYSSHSGQKSYAVVPSSSRSKPPIHYSDGRNSKQSVPPRSSSVSRAVPACRDPNCAHPGCLSLRNPERRYTVPREEHAAHYRQPAQYGDQAAQYPASSPTQAMPTAPTRPTLTYTTRPRPTSMYGYPPVSYAGGQHGPPPSPSAHYSRSYYPTYPQPAPLYGSTPPNPTPIYTNYSTGAHSPTSPIYGPPLTRTISARTADPMPQYSPTKPAVKPSVRRTISAREHVPGAFIESEPSESDSDIEADYDDDLDVNSYDYDRESRYRAKAREDRERMPPPPSRQPSVSRRRDTIGLPPNSPRQSSRHRPSDTYYEISDSDRTARPSAVRASTDSSYSARSRRPSVSTTASSGRTKATTLSEGSQRVIIEDRHGRRSAYLSKEARDQLIRDYERQKLEEVDLTDRVKEYQDVVAGGPTKELTAANIERMTKTKHRTSGSHASGNSRRSSKMSKADGIRIETGGTVLHVHGSANVEMQPGADGGPARLIISHAGGDSAYGGSKSSGSRRGRSRGDNDFKNIREEDGGYERAL